MKKYIQIGKRLKYLRLEIMKFKSQRELAVFLGVYKGTIARYESGERLLSIHLCIILIKVFSINPNWLLFGHGKFFIEFDVNKNLFDPNFIGRRLKYAPKKIAGVSSQIAFSKLFEVSNISMALYQTDKEAIPTHILLKLHNLYGVSAIWFLFGIDERFCKV